jgi:hypothetical protein
MEKELINFASENNLSPFNKTKTPLKSPSDSIFKTKDAKSIHTKVLSEISKNFIFADTSNFFLKFPFTDKSDQITSRQNFFSSLQKNQNNEFLKSLALSRSKWKPPYGIVVVTEDDKTFTFLQKMNCPVKILLNETDVTELENADIVQVIDCENFSRALEQLPQTVFLKKVEEAYLERFVELLSQWSDRKSN